MATKHRIEKHTFVYFASMQDGRQLKVGYTKDVGLRLIALRALDKNIKLIGFMHGNRAVEQFFHRRFDHLRVGHCAEVFHYTDELRLYVGSLELATRVNVPLDYLKHKVRWQVFGERHLWPKEEVIEKAASLLQMKLRYAPNDVVWLEMLAPEWIPDAAGQLVQKMETGGVDPCAYLECMPLELRGKTHYIHLERYMGLRRMVDPTKVRVIKGIWLSYKYRYLCREQRLKAAIDAEKGEGEI